jgi:2-keto-4-pentenoate hydratase/2-oxohepta-3-ene-1,7-dioic acid hydratase in catechol pathway
METLGYDAKEGWLKEGDEVELQVEGLGVLKNKIVLVGDELE